MRRFLALLALVAVLAAACGDDAETVTTDDPDDGGTTRPSVAGDWILASLAVDGVEIVVPAGGLAMTIELGGISGDLGCNSFFGDIDAADDGSLTVGALGQTEMACLDDGRMDLEAAYGRALSSVTSWSVDPAGMTFSGDTAEIRYTPAPPPVHQPLEATVWHFDTIYEGEGVNRAATNRADMDGVTLVIDQGRATVSSPACAGGEVPVEHDSGRDGSFAVGDATVDLPTVEACEIVGLAFDGLAAATGFMIDENRLTFIGAAGETVGFSARPA